MIFDYMVSKMGESIIKESCKICGYHELTYKFVANKCTIAQCSKCTFVQMADEENVPRYDYSAKYFENSKYKDIKALQKEHSRRKKLLKKYVLTGARVLDAGCATGEFVEYISGIYEAWGCDISNEAISMARKKIPSLAHRFSCGTVENILADDKKYDAICLWDVVEHVSNPYEALKGIQEKLNENGYLFISTPNIGAIFPKIMKSKWPFMTPPEHLCFFTKESFELFFSNINMEIVEWCSRGKWANVGFILYKINRVSSAKIPECILKLFQNSFLSKWNIYVPTGDIQYLVIKKKV